MVEKVSPDTPVFVVSDHGGGPTSDRVLYLNRFLAQLGLLHYTETKTPAPRRSRRISSAGPTISCAALSARGRKLCSQTPFLALRKRFETAATSYTNIDWSRTKAFCSEVLASPPGIWINRKGVKPAGIVDEADMSRC